MMSRREFGGEVGGMFVGGSLLVAQGRGGSGPGPAADPVGDHILREAIRGAKAVQAGTPSAETFNALAANFRLHAAHAKALDLDGRVKRIVGRQIDRRGRAAVVDDAIEHEHGDHHERLHALDLDGLDVGSHDLSRSQYEQGLSALLVSGLTPALEEATSVLERAARSIARLTTPNGLCVCNSRVSRRARAANS